jgi:hypothetical protein
MVGYQAQQQQQGFRGGGSSSPKKEAHKIDPTQTEYKHTRTRTRSSVFSALKANVCKSST